MATRLSNDEDKRALGQMEREDKLYVSSNEESQVFLVEVPFLSGLIGFHFKGSFTTYWTYMEAISHTAPVVAATPKPAATPDVGGVEGATQEIINGQTVTVLPN
jgi:hypothetical protein